MKPLAVFPLAIRTRHEQRARKQLHVYVWEYVRDLRAAAQKASTRSVYYWRNAAGAYNGILVYSRSGRLIQFGRVHLWQKMIGGGYVEHEFQHFLHHYTEATEHWPLDPDADERIAYLAGDLTAQFWSQFYDWENRGNP